MENLPPTLFIAIGTIFAALITAVIAIVTMIMSKDLKISELRQDWINSLRIELSELLSIVNNLSIQWNKRSLKTQESFDSFILESKAQIQEIDKYVSLIRLRLNPKEHSVLLNIITEIELTHGDLANAEHALIVEVLDRYLKESSLVLKNEWEVVKNGGTSFKKLKKAFDWVIFVSLFLLMLALYIA